MCKRYAAAAVAYGVCAMVFGVFYREFTKFFHFTGWTALSVLHTHYFLLGMFFFLILMLVEKSFGSAGQKHSTALFLTYQLGLNLTGLGFLLRGLTQVLATPLSRGVDAAISGTAGTGHLIFGISMILLLLNIKKQVS